MTPASPPARTGAPSGFALFVVAFFASPLILVAWVGGQALLRATGWPRWRVATAAVAAAAGVVWVHGGPVPAVAAHFSGYSGVLSQFGRPLVHLPTPGSFLWPQIALSVPVGILADLDPDLSECWWFVPGVADLVWLREVLAGIPCAIGHEVYPLTGDLRGVVS